MMGGRTVVALAVEDLLWLGRWRTLPGLEACEAEGRVWVRGTEGPSWSLLPALARYVEDASGRLLRPGGRVPVRRLPEGPWMSLTELLRVRPTSAVLPAQHVAPVAWGLVPAKAFREAALLLLPFDLFAKWCLNAPSVRLRSLQFALNEEGRACVRGDLLPSLPGMAWCLEQNIATPSGWALPPGITPALVADSMRLAVGEIALLHTDITVDRLPKEAFVAASRSAIRATLAAKV